MKLSAVEIAVLAVGVAVAAPVLAVLLSPSPDAVSVGWVWLIAAAVFVAGFIAVRRLTRRGGRTP